MTEVKRKVTFKLYPNKSQTDALFEIRSRHRLLYNTALEQRTWAWTHRRKTVTFAEQCKELTALRGADPFFASLNAQSCQVTLKRLEFAFRAFFRRCANGETPGFPRFKSPHRFSGWGYKTHGDGWTLKAGENMKNGRLRISGVGEIRIRGKARTPGTPKTMEIMYKRGKWYASVTVLCTPERTAGERPRGFDWGLERFATFEDGTGVENPRFLRKAEEKIKEFQREVSRKKRGGRNWIKAVRKLAAEHARIARQRKDFLHQESARLVAGAAMLGTEQLALNNMTRSAKGTLEEPGKNVRQKAGLNRSILDGAPGGFLGMVRWKAEEAAVVLVEVPTRKVKPSQRCPRCGAVRKKKLSERWHSCPCGCEMPRDQASALVCLNFALALDFLAVPVGNFRAGWPPGHETHSIAPHALEGVVHFDSETSGLTAIEDDWSRNVRQRPAILRSLMEKYPSGNIYYDTFLRSIKGWQSRVSVPLFRAQTASTSIFTGPGSTYYVQRSGTH